MINVSFRPQPRGGKEYSVLSTQYSVLSTQLVDRPPDVLPDINYLRCYKVARTASAVALSLSGLMEAQRSFDQKEVGNSNQVIACALRHRAVAVLEMNRFELDCIDDSNNLKELIQPKQT